MGVVFRFVILLRLYGSFPGSAAMYYGCITAETGIGDVWT